MFKNRNELEIVPYEIDSYSSFISGYHPEKIKVDNPTDPASRWSSTAMSIDQFITLKLAKPSVLVTITFGKYCKVHVCNVKELRVLSGEYEVLRCSLRNDTESETFNLRYTAGNTYIITDKLKICPLSSWGMNFNYSFWFVEVRGVVNLEEVKMFNKMYGKKTAGKLVMNYLKNLGNDYFSDITTVHSKGATNGQFMAEKNDRFVVENDECKFKNNESNLINAKKDVIDLREYLFDEYLKILNQLIYLENNSFGPENDLPVSKKITENRSKNECDSKSNKETITISVETNDSEAINKHQNLNEDRDVSNLIRKLDGLMSGFKYEDEILTKIKKLIRKRRYDELEEEIKNACNAGLVYSYIERLPYEAVWEEVVIKGEKPCERGGHQMVEFKGKIFLYGGWDGEKELDDFWEYDPQNVKWKRLNSKNGPGRRSCHKMVVLDGAICLYGRYIPVEHESQTQWIEREFFHYKNGVWSTKKIIGGPINLFDHQMVGVEAVKEQRKTNKGTSDCFAKNDVLNRKNRISGHVKNEDHFEKSNNKIYNSEIKTANDEKLFKGADLKNSEDVRGQKITNNDVSKNSEKSTSKIYIFGGRSNSDQNYSGLYCLKNNVLKCIRGGSDQPRNTPELKGRVGHVLLHIPADYFSNEPEHLGKFGSLCFYNNTLLIVGGQRVKDTYREITFYNLETDTVYKNIRFPLNLENKFVQRAFIRGCEIFVFFCYAKEKDKINETALFIYNLKFEEWIQCKSNEGPSARSAHQMAICNDIYLHGGNAGVHSKRCGDMWKLTLNRKSVQEVMQNMLLIVRKHKFFSFSKNVEAFAYFKKHVSGLVDEKTGLEDLKKLCCMKLRGETIDAADLDKEIMGFFGEDVKGPAMGVEDLCL